MNKLAYKPSMGLSVFFGTEMWERYGFYIVQSLLALYLSLQLHMEDAQVYMLVGSFTALTYISPIIGGWVADNFLGQRRAVFTGGFILFLSYILLAFSLSLNHLILAFSGIAMGTGLLKPNISSLLGRQYSPSDPKRNSAFTIFYLGITTGIILGTTLPSKLQFWFGWKACFLSAAIGMVLAIFVFFMGTKLLKIEEYAVLKRRMLINWIASLVIIVFSGSIFYLVLSHSGIANTFFIAVATLAVVVVLRIAFKEEGDQRRKTLSLLILFAISTCFWAFYFEMFMMLTLFITRTVEPVVLGIRFPAPYYVSVQSFGMIVFGIFLAKLWARMRYRNAAYAISIKFTIAIACMFLAYSVILITSNNNSENLLSPWPILFAYVLISLAELMLSPIGLSAVTRLGNSQVVSTLMGVFFVSLGIGGFLSGQLSKIVSSEPESSSLIHLKESYFHGFSALTWMLFFVLIFSGVSCSLIKRLSRNICWEKIREEDLDASSSGEEDRGKIIGVRS
jgi:POT family proton-dependent oligopeptide transporter